MIVRPSLGGQFSDTEILDLSVAVAKVTEEFWDFSASAVKRLAWVIPL
jgi:hypothetical protein